MTKKRKPISARVVLSDELLKRLQARARKEQRSVSNTIRLAIEKYL